MEDLHIIFVGSFVWAISGLVPHVFTELPDEFAEQCGKMEVNRFELYSTEWLYQQSLNSTKTVKKQQ